MGRTADPSPLPAGSQRSRWSPRRTALVLLAAAALLRFAVVGVMWGLEPNDWLSDAGVHLAMVHDPAAQVRGELPDTVQYPAYLGYLEGAGVRPALAAGTTDPTALRVASVVWDLVAMAILLAAVARWRPRSVGLVGALWAFAPIVWPASAVFGQDETIDAAFGALVVWLVASGRRRAATVVAVVAMFAVKAVFAPVVVALVVTSPRTERMRRAVLAAVTAAASAAVTWLLGGGDGLTRQLRYEPSVVGFSVSGWSPLALHHLVAPAVALPVSSVLAAAALAAVARIWWERDDEDPLSFARCCACAFLAPFAVLAISNPEYLCLAAPFAVVACLGAGERRRALVVSAVGAAAWATNLAYYLLRKEFDPTGAQLGVTGLTGDLTASVRWLAALHAASIAAYTALIALAVWQLVSARAEHPPPLAPA
ncbi:MAG: hypothetical protein R2701_04615 [Acidimicrobiales bacterium]